MMHLATVLAGVTCLGSFSWAMRALFTLPQGKTPQIRRFTAIATTCGLLHVLALTLFPGPSRPLVFGSLALYVVAMFVFWWAVRTTLKRRLSFAFSSDLPEHLCTNGPYRWIRHPFYFAYLTVWIAGVLATQQWWLGLTVWVMYRQYAQAARLEEEKFAASTLAGEYARYAARTGRFIPRFR